MSTLLKKTLPKTPTRTKCKPGEALVTEHCRKTSSAATTSEDGKRRADDVERIKAALEKVVIPTTLTAKNRQDVGTVALINRMNRMPENVAECVESMLRYPRSARADVDDWYGKASSNIQGTDFSKNPYMKQAVLKILLRLTSS